MSGKWPLLSERLTRFEMVGKSSLMQSLTILKGIGSLSQVLFAAFSTSFLTDTFRRYRLEVSKGCASIRVLLDATPGRVVKLIWWGSMLSSFKGMSSIFCVNNLPKSLASIAGSECLGYCSCVDPPSSALAVLKSFLWSQYRLQFVVFLCKSRLVFFNPQRYWQI